MTRSRPRHLKRAPLTQRLAPWGAAAAVAGLVAAIAVGFSDDAPLAAAEPNRESLGEFSVPVRPLEQYSRAMTEARPAPPAAGRPGSGRGGEATIELTPVGHRFLTEDLNFWSGPGEDYELVDVIPAGERVPITGETSDGWTQVLVQGTPGWVNSTYLTQDKPVEPEEVTEEPEPQPDAESPTSPEPAPDTSGGISTAPCPSGSSVEEGLTPDAIRVHRGVCALFPEVTSYGGLRSDGEHGEGRALDIMVPSSSTGDAIADWVRDNHAALGVSEVIWAQRIWTVERSSEGWRWMEDRGSDTANHYDHVHVTVYGDAGG